MSWESNAAQAAGLVRERELAEARAEIERLQKMLADMAVAMDLMAGSLARAAENARAVLTHEQTEDENGARTRED